MAANAKRLGKGLSALIPQISSDDSPESERLIDIEISQISPNPFQPRETFDPVKLAELKQSISENGIIQPISVRAVDSGYELIAGERRLRAVRELGLERIPVYVMEVNTDEEMLELSLVENIQRDNLNPIDEANGYQTLISKCKLTQDEVATKVGKDRSTITNALRVLKLPKNIQESIIKGEITSGHARAYLTLPNRGAQVDLWKKTLRKKYSVRQLENIVKNNSSTPKVKVSRRKVNPFLHETENKLRTILATQVRIVEKAKGKSGKIEVEYYSTNDLERIVELIEKI